MCPTQDASVIRRDSIGDDEMNQTHQRILRILNEFGESLEKAWDVPRSISLPGLSESMNLVRSGLHKPLKNLEDQGYVSKRLAHVVGGGSRKRQVFHITHEGRAYIASLSEDEQEELPEEHFNHQYPLFGREDIIMQCISMIEQHGMVAIGGLSGIGKSIVARHVSERICSKNGRIRKVNFNEGMDARQLMRLLYHEDSLLPQSLEGMCEYIQHTQSKCDIILLDDVHLISQRHNESVFMLINSFAASPLHDLILVGRNPFEVPTTCEILTIEPLYVDDAVNLLSDTIDLDRRKEIVTALGGHPYAILLYNESIDLPEKQGDVQTFVETTILNHISESALHVLDLFCLFPKPVRVEQSFHQDVIADLDEAALLRLMNDGLMVELHHFIRNVRRGMLSDSQLHQLHLESADHWSQFTDDNSLLLQLYHLLNIHHPDELGEKIEHYFDLLISTKSSELAVIFDAALKRNESHETLNYFAALTALDRNEIKEATSKIPHLTPAHQSEIEFQIALQSGNTERAEQIMLDLLSVQEHSVSKNRMVLSFVIQQLDDRLFDVPTTLDVRSMFNVLESIVLPEDQALRSATLVSISMIKHSIHLYRKEYDDAKLIREQLTMLSNEHDTLVQTLELRSALVNMDSTTLTAVIEEFESLSQQLSHVHHRMSLTLSMAESAFDYDKALSSSLLESIRDSLDHSRSKHAHRLYGRWWYLQSKLNDSKKLICLKDAILHFRIGGCSNNVKQIQTKIHRLL